MLSNYQNPMWFNSSLCYEEKATTCSKQYKYRFIYLLLSPVAIHRFLLLLLNNETSSQRITQGNKGRDETKEIRCAARQRR